MDTTLVAAIGIAVIVLMLSGIRVQLKRIGDALFELRAALEDRKQKQRLAEAVEA